MTGSFMMMATQSTSIQPMVTHITVPIPIITIGGIDGIGIRTMVTMIHSTHTTAAGTIDTIGMGIIGMDTTGMRITTDHTIIMHARVSGVTCRQTECFQQQEWELLHATIALPVQPMAPSIHAMDRTGTR